MSEFTKGKWIAQKRTPTLFEIRNVNGKLVCELENYERNKQIMGYQELEANAKLIASAPEMLEMLQKMYDYYSTSEIISGSLRSFMIETRELIKKATE